MINNGVGASMKSGIPLLTCSFKGEGGGQVALPDMPLGSIKHSLTGEICKKGIVQASPGCESQIFPLPAMRFLTDNLSEPGFLNQ